MSLTAEKVYEEVCENWRFLAKWRQLGFAGHLTVLTAVLSFAAVGADRGYPPSIIAFCFLLASVVGPIFWLADSRTHRLTTDACEAARGLEEACGNAGFFKVNNLNDKAADIKHSRHRRWFQWDRHSYATALLFGGSSLFCFVLAVMLWTGVGPQHPRPLTAVWEYKIIQTPASKTANFPADFGDQMTKAGADGWEFLSTGTDPSTGAFIILRRSKK